MEKEYSENYFSGFSFEKICQITDELIRLEECLGDDPAAIKALKLQHKTLKVLLDSFTYCALLDDDEGWYFNAFFSDIQKLCADVNPLLMFYLSKTWMSQIHEDFMEILPFLDRSLEYVKHSKHPFDSPVEVAFTHASISYLYGQKDVSEIQKLYRAGLDLINEDVGFNSKRNINGLDLFIMFVFVVREEHNKRLDLVHEFHSENTDIRYVDKINKVVQKFLKYFDYAGNSTCFDMLIRVAFHLIEACDWENIRSTYGWRDKEYTDETFLGAAHEINKYIGRK